jgi:Flp pilus assembly protein TadG
MWATRRVRRKPWADRGAVTVESAFALCAFITVLGFALGAVAAVSDQLRCTDAAREAARLVARGEDDMAKAAAAKIAPDGADIAISVAGDTISVDVRAAPLSGLLPGVQLHGEAYAIREPGAERSDE